MANLIKSIKNLETVEKHLTKSLAFRGLRLFPLGLQEGPVGCY